MKAKLALLASLAAVQTGTVFAAVPTEISTAISDAQADAVTVASAVLVAVIALFAIKFMRKGL